MDLRELAYQSHGRLELGLKPIVVSGEITLSVDSPNRTRGLGMLLQVPLDFRGGHDLHCVIHSRILWDPYTGSR
jgi:hypothetical protein